MKSISIFFSFLVLTLTFGVHLFAQNTPIQTNVPALKEVYANDFYIGCLLSYKHVGFASDPKVSGQSAVIASKGGELIKYHMNSMSPGNNMKSIYTIDIPGSASAYNSATNSEEKDSIEIHPKVRFNGDLIAQLNWAKRQGFTFRGHTLVWHSQSPAEFFRSGYTANGTRLTKEVMTQRMENYIKEVIRLIHENWPGMLSAIDVVNESISDSNGAFRTSNNEYYTTFGDQTYVMKAFEFARKYTIQYGETQIKLYYNDYSTSNSSKADGIVQLCKPIYEAGLLDGIGMQEHDSNTNPSAQAWINSYNKFDKICNEMAVTELDVSTNSGTNTPSSTIHETQANQYAALFKCFVERSYLSGRGKIINVSKDGLNDQYTFVTNQSSSLWDINNQCKPAFYAVANVGTNYNKLDSLIGIVENLSSSNYSTEAWTKITAALTKAKGALAKNYSASNPAVKGLEDAIALLENALTNPTGIKENTVLISIKAYGGFINVDNIQEAAQLSIYRLNGVLLETIAVNSTTIKLPYWEPCIVRVISGKEVITKKVIQ
jgi:GH35 family endo-1,4-beta-xylanase